VVSSLAAALQHANQQYDIVAVCGELSSCECSSRCVECRQNNTSLELLKYVLTSCNLIN